MSVADPRFQVTVRDRGGREVEGVGAYVSLECTPRFRDVGDFTLVLPTGHHAVPLLQQEGYGVVVRRTGEDRVVCSGEVADADVVDGDPDPTQNVATFTGATDEEVLSGDLVQPNPEVPVPIGGLGSMGPARDEFVGRAEDALLHYVGRNIGQDAALALRRRLVVPQSLGRGRVGRWSERWSTLLDVAQRIGAVSKLGWRVVQDPYRPQVVLEVWTPSGAPVARFSPESGTVGRRRVVRTTPDFTDVVVAGGGQGTGRLLTRVTAPGDTAEPFFPLLPLRLSSGEQVRLHRARTKFLDQRQTESFEELDLAGRAELEGLPSPLVVEITVVEQEWLRWGTHYDLGDVVQVSTGPPTAGGVHVQDVVTAVHVVDDEGGLQVTPTVGFTGSALSSEPLAQALRRQVEQVVKQ